MRISVLINDEHCVEIYFEELGYWEEFDVILEVLERKGCSVYTNQEMVYARRSELGKDGINFTLVHDSALGNFLFSTQLGDLNFLSNLGDEIIKDIQARLGFE